ncbi:plasma-membrane proton-efflux P-type ATPase [Crocosphaera sp. UHCC 0190]|uniref:plasma-membrane proton-efflux P-type ATPase n=1 Tax=Crocosphaera sp. UHCC 0190 TaxID=3110246 RepID=UPI002B21B9DB|nr:plasma-membrane proton-efflux P-type ATPase [Crocosphaera sp. UHCC 0190]MEA5509891.1 plasma-membrane proton-efflux P-type ATPase [Crocosphaera sp. UHCC 0190]
MTITLDQEKLSELSLEDLKKKLGTSNQGLSNTEAIQRQSQEGYNELPEETVSPVMQFLSHFWGPIAWMIEAAVVLSALVGDWVDFGIILALLIGNSVVGFWEEFQAGNAIAALKAKLALKAKVKRDNTWTTIPSRELVSGDLIRLRLGDIVPADVRFLAGDPVKVDQSALTGESLPVECKVGGVLYSGSILKQGELDGIVYATGVHTYIGKTAHLVQSAHTVSHFQRAVLKIGDYLILIAMVLVVLVLIVTLFRGDPWLTTLRFLLVLTVASIPVAMPTVLSVTMAVGAQKLAKKDAIVSRLAAIEEMAGIDILCSDKTGTLTLNQLTLGEPFCRENTTPEDVILNASLASREENEDPIDLAILKELKPAQHLDNYRIVHFQPFDPVSKRTEATVENSNRDRFKVSKGAPQVILKLSSNVEQVQPQVDQAIDEFARRGFRSLGVARTDAQGNWQFLGILPLFDPPRSDSQLMIREVRKLGISLKMLTGDQQAIASETAHQLGLKGDILDASLLEKAAPHQAGQVADKIEAAAGFAQVFPEHKYHIVEVLQQRGHLVGMAGDGVNDAPALKKADAGIAVSGATDAARAAADIVLLTPGLSVIVEAIQESRRIFQRMNNYAIYRITETIRILLFMTLSILVYNFYPVTAIMIVLLALLNDGAIISIAYDNTRPANRPETWNMPIVLGLATILGVTGLASSFGMLYLGERYFNLDRSILQTLIYLKLSIAGHLTIFVTRTKGPFWSIKPARILLIAVLGTQFLATLIAVYGIFMTPLGWGLAGFAWIYALIWFLIADWVKQRAYGVFNHAKPVYVTKGFRTLTQWFSHFLFN